eukprot:TRINITY_DN2518_c1_g3_i5.p1 TRINITY_DN2518_c1_g3~~TRINITY_DN2518_c1_g3_i5.p1  ORF type:complete len:3380 (-),score=1371.77 TRINITY_DN2518_c1_g3_i5:588-10727(-)
MNSMLKVTLLVLVAVLTASQTTEGACECGWKALYPTYMYEDTVGEYKAVTWGSYRKWDCKLNYVTPPSSQSKIGKCQVNYYPSANWFGKDYVEWRIDGECQDRIWPATSCWGFKWDQSFSKAYDLEVRAWNDAPTADSKTVYTQEDTSIVITLSGNDIDAGDASALRYWIGSFTSGSGTFKNYDGTNLPLNGYTKEARIRFYPSAHANKDTGYVPKFEYWTQDPGNAWSSKAIVTVSVTAVNDNPVANSQSRSTNEDTSMVITLSGSDIETSASGLNFYMRSLPTKGTLKQYSGATLGATSQITDASRRVRYYPAPNDSGGPYTFKFRVRDGNSAYSSDATVSITVNAVNDAPTGVTSFSGSTNEDTAVLFTLTGSDIDGPANPTKFVITQFPSAAQGQLCQESGCTWPSAAGHKLVTSGTGKVRFIPAAHYHGSASFQYRAYDNTALSAATGTVSITINSVNDAPCAGKYSGVNCVADMSKQIIAEDVKGDIDPLAAVDIDGDAMTYQIYAAPTRGTLYNGNTVLSDFSNLGTTNNNLKFKGLPNGNTANCGSCAAGVYTTFQYRVHDGKVWSQPRTVQIDVTAVNDPPSSTASFTVDLDMAAATPALTLSGTDIDSTTLNYRITAIPAGVTVETTGGANVALNSLVGSNKIVLKGFSAGTAGTTPPYKSGVVKYKTYDGALDGPEASITLIVYPAVSVSGFTPTAPQTAAGGVPMVINGADFTTGGQALSASIGGVACSPITASALTSLTCTLPAGTGVGKNVVVTRGSSSATAAAKFSYKAPTITSTNPTAARVATKVKSGDLVEFHGDDFGPPPGGKTTIEIGGVPCTAYTYVSNKVTKCNVPAPPSAGVSRLDLTVKVTVDGQQTTPALKFSYLDTTPPTPGTLVGGLNVLDGASGAKDEQYATSSSELKAVVKGANEPESEIAKLEYAVGTSKGAADKVTWTSVTLGGGEKNALTPDKVITITKSNGFFTNGASFYVSVRATNLHGGVTKWEGNGVKVDTTAPSTGTIKGPKGTTSLEYQTTTNSLSFSWNGFSDAESGIKEYTYTLRKASDNSAVDAAFTNKVVTGTSVTLNTAGKISNNVKYQLEVTATNNVGMTSAAVKSPEIFIDTQAPTNGGTIKDGSGADKQYQSTAAAIQANWDAFTDAESGVDSYDWRVVEKGQTASIAGLDWNSVGGATSASGAPSTSFANGKTYEVQVRATDKAGLTSLVAKSNGVTIDTTPPTASVLRDGATGDLVWWSDATKIAGNWNQFNDPESNIVKIELAIGSTLSGSDVQAFVNVPNPSSATTHEITGQNLTPNTLYHLTVRATNGAGLSTTETSNGFRVDTTAPAITATAGKVFAGNTPGTHQRYQQDDTKIQCSWTAFSEPESGVKEYEWSVSLTADNANPTVVGWTKVGAGVFVGEKTVALTDQTDYYCQVRARNNAELLSVRASSPVITITTTPPAGGSVYEGPTPDIDADLDWTQVTNALTFSWAGFVFDAQFTKLAWEIRVDSTTGTVVKNGEFNTAPTGVSHTVGFSPALTQGKKYFVLMQLTTVAGDAGWKASDGITVDTTAPTAGTVVDNGLWVATLDTISASWSAAPFGDDVAQNAELTYEYCIAGTTSGTAPSASSACSGGALDAWTSLGPAQTFSRTDLTLEDYSVASRTYYVKVKCTNPAGLSAYAISTGVRVDSNAPAGTAPFDGTDGSADAQYTNSANQLSGNWKAFTATSGIAKYEYSFGKSSGAGDVRAFTDAGAATSATITEAGLTDQQYYFTIRATSNSGLSTDLHSNGILRDTTKPSTGPVKRGADAAKDITVQTDRTQIALTWSGFSDSGSGLKNYEVSVNTDGNPATADQHPWSPVAATAGDGTFTVTLGTGKQLVDGQDYHVSIRAVDNVGLTSDPVTTGAIRVDGSAPTSKTMTVQNTNAGKNLAGADVLFQSDDSTISLAFDFDEPHSSITEYEWALSQTGSMVGAGGAADFTCTGCFTWESTGTTKSGFKGGLSLTQGASYFLYTRATNQAGLVGYQAAAKPVVIDTTAPAGNPVTVANIVNAGTSRAYSSDNANIGVSFSAFTDSESPVSHQWAIGTSAGDASIQAMTAIADPSQAQSVAQASNDGDVYVVTVRGVNGAGLQTDVSTLEVLVDSTPPSTAGATAKFVANDGSGTALTYITDLNKLEGQWAFAANAEPHSGILDYEFAYGSSATGLTYTSVASASTGQLSVTLTDKTRYKLYVTARNNAHLRSTVLESAPILVDVNAPTPGQVFDNTQASERDYQKESDRLTGEFTAFTECPTDCSGIAKYEWKAYYLQGTNKINVFPYEDLGASVTALSKTGLTLTPGETYFLVVRATDNAGNTAEATSDGILVLDPNAAGLADDPPIPLDGKFADKSGAVPVDKDIWADKTKFTAHWGTFSDTTNPIAVGVVRYWFGIHNAATIGGAEAPAVQDYVEKLVGSTLTEPQANWYESELTGLNLVDGNMYYAVVKGCDLFDKCAVRVSDGFMVLSIAPDAATVYDGPTAGVDIDVTILADKLEANWDAWSFATIPDFTTAKGGSFVYEVAIGTSATGTDVLDWTPESGTAFTMPVSAAAASAVEQTDAGVDQLKPQRYYARVRGYPTLNGAVEAGVQSSDAVSDGLLIDGTPPTGEFSLVPQPPVIKTIQWYPFPGKTLTLDFNSMSDPESSPLSFRFKVDWIEEINANVSTPVTAATNVTIAGWTEWSTDTTQSMSWADDQPKVGAIDVMKHMESYRVTAEVKNAAGGMTTVVKSFKIDETPPSSGALDDTDRTFSILEDIDYTTLRNYMAVKWPRGSLEDSLESGIASATYMVGTSPGAGNVIPSTAVPQDSLDRTQQLLTPNVTLSDNTTYYVTVSCTNGAGLTTTISTDGLKIDNTPPTAGPVGVISGMINPRYSNDPTQLNGTYSGFYDTESGLFNLEYALHRSDEEPQVWKQLVPSYTNVKITGRFNENVRYLMSVRATNNAGLVTVKKSEEFVLFDTQIPTPVRDPREGLPREADPNFVPDPSLPEEGLVNVDFQADQGSIGANWEVFLDAGGSGMWKYEWGVGTERGGATDVVPFTSAGIRVINVGPRNIAMAVAEKKGLNLQHGKTYYVTVRGYDNANNVAWAYADGVMIDITPPVVTNAIVSDGPTDIDRDLQQDNRTMTATWSDFDDPESGIAFYHFCIGTQPDKCNKTLMNDPRMEGLEKDKLGADGWYSTLEAPRVSLNLTVVVRSNNSDSVLTFGPLLEGNNITYFAVVRATNGAGLTGIKSSDGVKIGTNDDDIVSRQPGDAIVAKKKASTDSNDVIIAAVASGGVIGAGIAGFLGLRSLRKRGKKMKSLSERNARRAAMAGPATPAAAESDAFLGDLEPLDAAPGVSFESMDTFDPLDEVESSDFI